MSGSRGSSVQSYPSCCCDSVDGTLSQKLALLHRNLSLSDTAVEPLRSNQHGKCCLRILLNLTMWKLNILWCDGGVLPPPRSIVFIGSERMGLVRSGVQQPLQDEWCDKSVFLRIFKLVYLNTQVPDWVWGISWLSTNCQLVLCLHHTLVLLSHFMLFHKIVSFCVFVLPFLPSFLFLFSPLPLPWVSAAAGAWCGSGKALVWVLSMAPSGPCSPGPAGLGCHGVCSLLIPDRKSVV